jgi:hypothetical protein
LKFETVKRNRLHGLMVREYLKTLNKVFVFIECMVVWSALKFKNFKRNGLHGLMVRGYLKTRNTAILSL